MFKQTLAAALLALASQASQAAIDNGSFESGFDNWSVALENSITTQHFGSFTASKGSNFALLQGEDVLSTWLSNETGTFTFNFAVTNAAGQASVAEVGLFVGGQQVSAQTFSGSSWGNFAWAVPAGFDDILEIRLTNGTANQRLLIDNANVGAITAPVPEPETYALMGMGLVGLLAARRRKTK
jgi:hypothetical protein